MADIKKIIASAIEKKPLDLQEMVNEIMAEKVRGVVTEAVHGFEYEEELTEEEEKLAFFEEFHAEYGHLPEDEQLAIMEEISEEVELEEACCSKCDCDPCECGNKGKGKKSSGAGMSSSAMAKAVSANPSQDSVTKEEFFAAFQEEYGHLPLEEQEAILEDFVNDEDEFYESSKAKKAKFLNSVADVEKQSKAAGNFYWNSSYHPKDVAGAKKKHARRMALAKDVYRRYRMANMDGDA